MGKSSVHFKYRPVTDRFVGCSLPSLPPSRLLPVAALIGALLQGAAFAQAPAAGGAAVPAVPPTPRVETDKPATGAAAPSGGPKFEIRKFDVEGVTLVPQARIDREVAPYTGQGRDFSDVQKALEALEKMFLDLGYGSVQVLLPEQELDQGVVKFKVIEPKVGQVTIEGNKAYSDTNIRASLPSLKEGTAPNSNEIAANLRLANENPGKSTTVLLRAGANDGEVDAVVRVAEEKVTRFNFTLDNTGAGGSGQYRVGLGMQSSNVFGRDHVFAAQAITSPDERNHFQGYSRDVAIFGMQYRIPIYRLGGAVDLTAGYSNVNSGVVQNIFNVSGRGDVAGVRYSQNLPKWGNLESKLIWSWDHRAYRNNVTPVNGGEQIIPNITVHPMSLTYTGTHRGQTHETSGYVSYSQNIPGGHAGGSADFEASRPGARPAYTLWRYGITHLRSFAGDWQVRLNLAGQFTKDRLVAGEQFGLGGANSIRGFAERQFANDYGVSANLELYTPDLAPLLKLDSAHKVRLLAFHDAGHVVRNEPLRNDTARTTAKGSGLGLRYTHGNNLSIRLDAAFADVPANQGGDSTSGVATPTPTSLKQFRMHGALIYLF
jgi:hemolysin activation/secretion protein